MRPTLFTIVFLAFTFLNNVEICFSQNLVWAKQLGGTSNDQGLSIKVDNLGNIYTTGYFQGTADFDPGTDTSWYSSFGYADIFINKLDYNGNLIWTKQMGGFADDIGNSIAIDSSGNVYTTGYFLGTVDFDPGNGIFNLTSHGGSEDIFICKLDSSGNFVWAKQLGGTGADRANSILVDSLGNVYTTGYFSGTVDFNPGSATYNLVSKGSWDIFISKLNSSGNFVWATRIGDTSIDVGNSMAVDVSGNIYTTGYFSGTVDFDPGIGINNLISAGAWDIFILKLDSLGKFVFAKKIGGNNNDCGLSIAVDSLGNIFTTGFFAETVDFDPGSGIHYLIANQYDIFISKLNSTGNFVWAKKIGGANDDFGCSLTIDTNGNIYITGYFSGTVDFNPGAGTYNLISTNNNNFVCELDVLGNFKWAFNLGGIDGNSGFAIALDALGYIYNTGSFDGTADFDLGTGTYNLISAGNEDIFISKYNQPLNDVLQLFTDNYLNIFPNPTNGKFNINMTSEYLSEINAFPLTISTLQGKVIYKSEIKNPNSQIDLSNQPSGIYIINFISGENVYHQKLVKE